jgi:type VI protein secretion system component VasK
MPDEREQREQYNYARRRVVQKKRLMRHFTVFLAGSLVLIIINPVLGIGDDWPVKNWFAWAILLWLFIFLVHAFNVLFLSSFMGKEWEDRQLEKLKARQEDRIRQLQKKVDADLLSSGSKKDDPRETDTKK